MADDDRGVLPWRVLLKRIHMMVVPWAMRAKQAKKRTFLGQELAEGGETQWCLCFLSLSQSLAAAWDVIPIHPTFPAVWAAILILWDFLSNSLASLFLLFCLSLGCQSSSLVWCLAHFLQEVKLKIVLICQGALSQAGKRCKINPALIAAWEETYF